MRRHSTPSGRTAAVASPGRSAAVVLAVLFAAAAMTCEDPSSPALASARDRIEMALGTEPSDYPLDAWDLVEGTLEGDTLRLEVRYSGGCVEHDFRLVAIEDWIDLPTAGPIPTREVPVLLSHEDHDDACDAIVGDTLRFGLGPLREAYRDRWGTGPARILLRLVDGRADEPVRVLDWLLP
jgi:hypothetical protein